MKKHSLPWKKNLKNEKIALIASHLQEIRGHALATMTVRGERLLQNNKPASDHEESDEDDTAVLSETWCTDSEGMSSDNDSVGDNESDSDTELPSSRAKRRCSTRSGQSATSFAFR